MRSSPLGLQNNRAFGSLFLLEPHPGASVEIHPSALLRIKSEADRRNAYRAFVADLRRAGADFGKPAA
jgi:hypothetical protein